MKVQGRSDTVSSLGRAAHDAGLGAILGGNLFARVGMHPAVREVADHRERGKVVNGAWRRYGVVNGLGLAAIVAGWAGARAGEARLKRTLNPLGQANLAASLALVGVNAAIGQANFRRPPVRRLLSRRY